MVATLELELEMLGSVQCCLWTTRRRQLAWFDRIAS